MRKIYTAVLLLFISIMVSPVLNAQVIISQYYEGNGTNKWIELTNVGTTAINTASPQLKLGLWRSSGTTGTIRFSGSPTQTVNLNITIPAKGTVLIGNTANGTEVPYLTAASAVQTSNTVINFDGNDGIALLNSSNTIIDRFGQGINANNVSYVRNVNITAQSSTFNISQWTSASLTTVQSAVTGNANRLGYHLAPLCVEPANQPTDLVFGSITTSSIAASFTGTATADEYLVVRSTNASLSSNPVDGIVYNAGSSLGGGTVVYRGASNSFTATGLSSGTNYYFFCFSIKTTNCSGGPNYLNSSPLTGSASTLLPDCVTPAGQPTQLLFNTTTSNSFAGSFTASAANEFLVVLSNAASLSSNPVNGTVYNAGDAIGNGTVISRSASTSFSSAGLNPNTTYYVFVFAINNYNCVGGPVYLTANPLNGSNTTLMPPCIAPGSQPAQLNFTSVTSNSIDGSFEAAAGTDGYLTVMSTSNSLSAVPVNGNIYNVGASLGGGVIIAISGAVSFSSVGLNTNTVYYFFVFSYNNTSCSGGPLYVTNNPLTGSQSTTNPACIAPAAQPTGLVFSSVTPASFNGNFTSSGADEYLVVMSTDNSLTANPVNGVVYNASDLMGNGTVLQRNASAAFSAAGLTASTAYYIYIFSISSYCANGPEYLTLNPLLGNITTNAPEPTVLNFYNGNLHSHSSYSDGNADNTARIPADDYEYAKNSLCMDFLGISDHNHATAGMQLADWQPGLNQAAAASTSSFVGLYGMEWGVIGTQGASGDNAGHMIVYGMDSLIGWESNNYQIYVPKSTYTGAGGLFEIINRHGGNALAYCAHPDNYDYDNLLNTTYDVNADNALVGTAVESGPAFSTNTTYSNPPTSLAYYNYYKNMLAKGYHLGPTIDHDNHNYTFGRTAKSRLVVMAYTLSQNNILEGIRRMRFYATQDCGAKINFTVNTQPLGSILRQAGAPVIAVNTITTNPVSSIKLMYGVPGSGTQAITLTSTTAASLNYTHTALSNLSTGYYFLDITETDGARIITAPVWYTRDDLATRPLSPVTTFFTINELDRVVLKWVTKNESNNQSFEIERSVDGKHFTTIGRSKGKGQSGMPVNYAVEDVQPVNGIAYYRLVQNDAAGKIKFSETKVVDRGQMAEGYFTVYPNPVHGQLTVKLKAAQHETTAIELFDMLGRRILNKTMNLIKGEHNFTIDMSKLNTGSYVIKVKIGNTIHTRVVTKF